MRSRIRHPWEASWSRRRIRTDNADLDPLFEKPLGSIAGSAWRIQIRIHHMRNLLDPSPAPYGMEDTNPDSPYEKPLGSIAGSAWRMRNQIHHLRNILDLSSDPYGGYKSGSTIWETSWIHRRIRMEDAEPDPPFEKHLGSIVRSEWRIRIRIHHLGNFLDPSPDPY